MNTQTTKTKAWDFVDKYYNDPKDQDKKKLIFVGQLSIILTDGDGRNNPLVFNLYKNSLEKVKKAHDKLMVQIYEDAILNARVREEGNAWDFVTFYYPNYTSSDEIAYCDDLCKIIDDEDEGDSEARKIFWQEFNGKRKKVKAVHREVLIEIYEKAIEAYMDEHEHETDTEPEDTPEEAPQTAIPAGDKTTPTPEAKATIIYKYTLMFKSKHGTTVYVFKSNHPDLEVDYSGESLIQEVESTPNEAEPISEYHRQLFKALDIYMDFGSSDEIIIYENIDPIKTIIFNNL